MGPRLNRTPLSTSCTTGTASLGLRFHICTTKCRRAPASAGASSEDSVSMWLWCLMSCCHCWANPIECPCPLIA